MEYDTLGRVKYEICKDARGALLQKREFCYDLMGRCIKQIEHVIHKGKVDRQVVHAFTYDSNSNLIKWIEALGTPEQNKQATSTTHISKSKIIKPDGTELQHIYDDLGRLSLFLASDQSFHYQYSYDANSNVIQVDDQTNHTVTTRTFDANNRLIQETLGNGLTIEYRYDGLARPLEIKLPDSSTIEYKYDSLHLESVRRGSYVHTYETYNLSGLLEKAKMIGKAGTVYYSMDKCKRLTNIKTSNWKEEIPKDGLDKVGNLLKKNTRDVTGTTKDVFL